MYHIPVLVEEVVENLITVKSDIYIDSTLGTGGHTEAILKIIEKNGKVIGLDIDEKSIEIAKERLKEFKNLKLFCESYINIEKLLEREQIKEVSGVFFDLGISSYQLSDSNRGFSFYRKGPLDMRFGQSGTITAEKIINNYSENKLGEIIKNYGGEKNAKKISEGIVKYRKDKNIETTQELVEIISTAFHSKIGSKGINLATKTFQALRIETNNEFNNIKTGISRSISLLKKGGRICVLSYHSLEDKIVKNVFRNSPVQILTKKPILPRESEIYSNPNSRSAKLRIAQKL